jgi:hypothetical protein
MAVADIILKQLGGPRFVVMTGAKHVLSDGPALVFQLPPRMAKDGINAVKITLDPSDTYTLRFSKIARDGTKATTVREVSGVYADQLCELFESTTGLATSLGTMGRRSGALRRSRGAKRSSRGKKRRSRRSR